MHGKIDILPQQRLFNFFNKESFAPKLCEWITAIFIPCSADDDYIHGNIWMMDP
jgi:hypothetical protein